MNFVLTSLLNAGLPALFAGVLWFLGGRFPRAHLWLSAVAVGGGTMLAYYLALGKPPFPTTDAQEWVFWYALGLIPLGWLMVIAAPYRWVGGWGLVLVLLWLFVWLFIPLMRSEYWSLTIGMTWILVFGVGLAVMALGVASAEARLSGWQMAFLLALFGGVSAGMMLYGAKSSSFAQLAGALGLVMGIAVPVGWGMRSFRVGQGAVAMGVVLYGLLWAIGFAYGRLQAPYLAVFALCMLAIALGGRGAPKWRFVVPLLLILLIGGGAVGMSYQAYMSASAGYGY